MEVLKSINDTFTRAKDSTVSVIAKTGLTLYLKKIGGKIVQFHLDSKCKKIFLEVFLQGEKELLTVEIIDYSFSKLNEETTLLIFKEIITSREWVNKLIDVYFTEKKIMIPSNYAKTLEIII